MIDLNYSTIDFYIGIDPSSIGGTSYGGICFMDNSGHPLGIIKLDSSPKVVIDSFKNLADKYNCVALLEKTWAMKGQGASSSYNFGKGIGFIECLLYSNNIPFAEVRPQDWMQHYGMKREKKEKTAEWKKRLCELSATFFPEYTDDKYLCDSLLITKYLYDEKYNIFDKKEME